MKTELVAVAVIGVVALVAYSQAKKDAAALAQAVNPADENNVVNSYFNQLYQTVTGSDQTLGADIYDMTH